MLTYNIKFFNKKGDFISPYYLVVFLFFFRLYSLNGQNFYETEGKQKVQIFEDGTYRIVQKNGVDYFSFHELDSLADLKKLEAQVNIIEAEYFVFLYMMQKEIDILQTASKRVAKEGNISEMNDYKKKIRQFKEKMNDNTGLYENALFYQKQARKGVQSPEKFKAKNRQKLEAYIDGKDYIFKTTKYARGEVQIWQKSDYAIPDKNPSDNQKSITVTDSPALPEKLIISAGNCRIFRENGDDTASISHEFEPVFLFTPQRLKVHLKEENLIECNAQISQTGNDVFLALRVVMRTKDASKSYGHIQEGNIIRFEFVNGIRLNLKAPKSVFGSIEEYSGKIVYLTKFKLDKEMVKQLQNIPLDYLGIMWTSGFEKYEIFEVDVLMRQLNCLKSLKNI